MKRFFYSLAIAISALFAGVACTPDATTSLELAQVEVSLPCTTGKASVPFTLVSPVDGTEFKFESSASWLSDFAVDKANSAITFKYDANCFYTNSTESREATFTVTYGSLESITVSVVQEALQTSPFNISWSGTTPTVSYYTCTPNDPTDFYLIQQVEKSTIDSESGATWEEKVYTWAEAMANAYYEECVNGTYPTEEMVDRNPDVNAFYKAEVEIYVAVIGVSLDTTPQPFSIGLYSATFPDAPVITFENSEVEFSSAAATGANSINITNMLNYGELKVTSSADWATATYNAETSKIDLSVKENTYARTRNAKISVSYEGDRGEVFASNAFNVKQQPNSTATAYNFDFSVVETHWDHAVLSVKPSDANVKYLVGAVASNYFISKYESNNDLLMGAVLAEALAKEESVLLSGEQLAHSIKLDTNYFGYENWKFYVFAVKDGEIASDLTMVSVDKVFNDKPEIAFCDDEVVHVPAEGGTFKYHYKFVSQDDPEGLVTDMVEGGAVRFNTYPYDGPIDDTWGLLEVNQPEINEEERAIIVKIKPFDKEMAYHYVSIGLVYYNKITGQSYNVAGIKIVQDAPAK